MTYQLRKNDSNRRLTVTLRENRKTFKELGKAQPTMVNLLMTMPGTGLFSRQLQKDGNQDWYYQFELTDFETLIPGQHVAELNCTFEGGSRLTFPTVPETFTIIVHPVK